MNINLNYIDLHNFGSFKDTTHFELPYTYGFCAVGGENLQDPKLQSNGAGKSTLWEALKYALYGRDSRGRPSTTLTNWHASESMWVELGLSIDGTDYVLRRGSDKASVVTWRLASAKAEQTLDQESLQSRLGLDASLFDHAVFHAQKGAHFLDLKPTEKLSLVATLINAQHWDNYVKVASEARSETSQELSKLRESLSHLEGRSQVLTGELNNAYIEQKTWGEFVAQEEAALKARMVILEESFTKLNTRTDKTERKEKLSARIPAFEEAIEEGTKDFNALRDEIAILDKKMGEKNAYFGSVEREKERIKQLRAKDYTCPLCGNKSDRDHIDKEWKRLVNLQAKYREEHNALRAVWEEKKASLAELMDLTSKAKSKLAAVRHELRDLEAEAHRKEVELERIKAAMTALREQQAGISKRKSNNPWNSRIETLNSQVVDINQELNETKKKIESLSSLESIYNWWSSTFKEVKLYLIQRICKQLELSVNNALKSLGMENYRIEFAVEKETKSGSLSQKFHVIVHSPHLDKPVPWESWSGGEEQRLKLATSCGIVDAIASLTGIRWNLEIWDEPSAHLSEAGVKDLIYLLEQRSQSAKKQVWTIDHRSLDDAGFLTYISVRKNEEGKSTIVSDA